MAQRSVSRPSYEHANRKRTPADSAMEAAGVRMGPQLRGNALVLGRGFVVAVVAKISRDPIRGRDGSQQNRRRNARWRGNSVLSSWLVRMH